MTSLKLFYQRAASAALLLELIVGAPDIAQAFTQIRGGGVGLESAPYIPPSAPYIPPPSSSGTPALTPRTQVPPPLPLPVALPHVTPRTSSGTRATQVKPNHGPDAGSGPATGGIGDGGAGGIDLTHAGGHGDATGDLYRKAY